MASNYNINTTQEQANQAAGVDADGELLGTSIAKNNLKMQEMEQLVKNAAETYKQSQLKTKQKTEADEAGVNPELSDVLDKEEALAYIKHSWNVGDDDPEVQELVRVWPEKVNRYTVQTILRKRDLSQGKSVGKPFTVTEGQEYPTTLKEGGPTVKLGKGSFSSYVGEDGTINYIPSGLDSNGMNSQTFKPVGVTKDGMTISPTRNGQLIVTDKQGNTRPWDLAIDGEPQPLVNPTVPGGEMKSLEDLQNPLEQLYRAKALFSPSAVGPIQDRLIQLSRSSGVDFSKLFTDSSAWDANNTAFRTLLQTALNDYIHTVSGAAVTPSEAVRLERAMPQSGKAQEAFMPALNEAIHILEQKIDLKTSMLEAAGFRNVHNIKEAAKARALAAQNPTPAPGAQPPAGAAPAQPGSERKTSNGTSYTVTP